MIASSLALALSASVVVAEPTLCFSGTFTQSCSGDKSTDVGIKWKNGSPQTTSSEPIDTLRFDFDNSGGVVSQGQYTESKFLINIKAGTGTNRHIELKSTAPLTIKNLVVDMGNINGDGKKDNPHRSFTLDLSGVTEGKYAFTGNIEVVGGRAKTFYSEAVFKAIFGGEGMKGNITSRNGSKGDKWHNNGSSGAYDVIFKNNANLDGNILLRLGENTFTFGDSAASTNKITGKVTASADGSLEVPQNTITFEGNGTIEGEILSRGSFATVNRKTVYNKVIFKQSGTIGKAPVSEEGSLKTENKNIIQADAGSNNITFQNTGNIYGDVLANGGKNYITANGTFTHKGVFKTDSGAATGNYLYIGAESQDFSTQGLYANQTTGNREGKENHVYFKNNAGAITINELQTKVDPKVGVNGGVAPATKLRNAISFANATSITIDSIQTRGGFAFIGNNLFGDTPADATRLSFVDELKSNNTNIFKNTYQSTVTENVELKSIDTEGGGVGINLVGNAANTIGNTADIQASSSINAIRLSGTGTTNVGNAEARTKTISIIAQAGNSTNPQKGANILILETSKNKVSLDKITINDGAHNAFAQNYLVFAGSTSNSLDINTLDAAGKSGGDNPSLDSKKSANLISFNGQGNTATIGKITTSGGKNYIGKGIMTFNNTDGSITDNGASFTITNDTNAFEGTLKITQGIEAKGRTGSNNVSFKSSSTAGNDPIITNTASNPAILANGGTNNLYLDTTAATTQPTEIIKGEVKAQSSGTNNIKLVGKNDGTTIGVAGNITTEGNGTNNIIFENAVWKPHTLPDGTLSETSGKLTASGGTTNLVFRKSTSGGNDGVTPYLDINNTGGTINLVAQGDINLGAHINYGANGSTGTTTLIFANGNSGTDNFGNGSNETAIDSNKVLGVTYKDGVKLTLKDTKVTIGDQTEQSFIDTYGKYFKEKDQDPLLTVEAKRTTEKDTVTINGLASGDISALAETTGTKTYDVTLNEKAGFIGSISLGDSSKINLEMKQSSKLFTTNEKLSIATLTIANGTKFDSSTITNNSFDQGNTIIDIATDGNDLGQVTKRSDFRLLEIGKNGGGSGDAKGLQGSNALFRVYVNDKADQGDSTSDNGATLGGNGGAAKGGNGTYGHNYSDRIIIESGESGNKSGKHYLQAIIDANTDITQVKYNGGGTEKAGNIAVATVKNGTAVFEGAKSVQGFDVVGTKLQSAQTDVNGKANGSGYTTYFLSQLTSQGASEANQLSSITALGLNYELFIANFNSINKRMGELRNNDHSQGAWGRVFNGSQSSEFGLQTTTNYTTLQAGYDYAFGFEGANNYLGVALSYAYAGITPKEIIDIDGKGKGIKNSTSHGVEVALYNSYVGDGVNASELNSENWMSGFYNDTIAKFSFITSNLSMFEQTKTYNTNNFGVVFSDEVGYRFKLGEENEWFIDPQLEVGVGYLNQSDLKQVLGRASLTGVQKDIITLRSRVGANFAYDFKKFTEGQDIKAQLYFGTYYAYDVINGGEIDLTTNLGALTSLKPLESSGRFELNIGTNLEVKDNTRIYFDFEKSFGGKINTDYQVNLGVRYSFGENTEYKPVLNTQENKEISVPIKVKEVEEAEKGKEVEGKEDKEGSKEVGGEEESKEEAKSE